MVLQRFSGQRVLATSKQSFHKAGTYPWYPMYVLTFTLPTIVKLQNSTMSRKLTRKHFSTEMFRLHGLVNTYVCPYRTSRYSGKCCQCDLSTSKIGMGGVPFAVPVLYASSSNVYFMAAGNQISDIPTSLLWLEEIFNHLWGSVYDRCKIVDRTGKIKKYDN